MSGAEGDSDPERLVGADRVLAVLLALGQHPRGVSLDTLASALGSPKPTIHRALVSLRRAGLASQLTRGTYVLGDEFLRLAFQNFSERPETLRIAPILDRLSERYGETTHYAVLDGTEVIYRAKADPPAGAVRLTSLVGGRNPAYCTAVGKLLLSARIQSREELATLLGEGPLPARTQRTITHVDDLWRELVATRERGYAVDDQENEAGVNCVAVPVRVDSPSRGSGAISVSALAFRLPLSALITEVPAIVATVDEL